MNRQNLSNNLLFLLIYFRGTSGCSSRNITCCDIQTHEGFKFMHKCPEGSQILIENSEQVVIAHFHNNTTQTVEGVKMDDGSVTTESCKDFKFKCVVNAEEQRVDEICVEIKVIENSCPAQKPKWFEPVIFSVLGSLIIIIIIIFTFIFIYCCWKRRMRNQNQNPELQWVDLESQPNGDICNGRDLRGSHENGTSQNNPVENVYSGDTGDPNASSAPHHRVMKREPDDGRMMKAAGDLKAEDHESKERLLPSDQPADCGGFDMTGQAEALVNNRGSDQDHVNRCSSAPDADVESTNTEELETTV